MRRYSLYFAIICLVTSSLLACQKGNENIEAKSTEPVEKVTRPSNPLPKEDPKTKPSEKPDKVVTSGLPRIQKKTKDKDATIFNRKGLKAHMAKKYAESAKYFEMAVKKDPGFILARYNLACALALDKKVPRSLLILKEFKDAACPMCLRKLIGASHDSDFAALTKDPRFIKVTKVDTATLRKGGAPKAAKLLEAAYKTGDLSPLYVWWPAAGKVKFRSYSTLADDKPLPKMTSVKKVEKSIKRTAHSLKPSVDLPFKFYGFGKIACKDNCCLGIHRGPTHHNAERLQKVCVDKDGAISHFYAYSD